MLNVGIPINIFKIEGDFKKVFCFNCIDAITECWMLNGNIPPYVGPLTSFFPWWIIQNNYSLFNKLQVSLFLFDFCRYGKL